MSCATPLGLGVLTAYRAGELVAEEASGLEEHLFACDTCGARAAWMEGLAAGVTDALRRGDALLPITAATADRMRGSGLTLREYHARPGESVACTVGADDDFLVTYLHAELAGVSSVDLVVIDEAGVERQRTKDLPVDATSGHVVYAISGKHVRPFPSTVLVYRLETAGRQLGDYTFVHTAFRAP